jgi:fructose-1-phosphate kinase PfkB-like protein
MIITVTLNPAIDQTLVVDILLPRVKVQEIALRVPARA